MFADKYLRKRSISFDSYKFPIIESGRTFSSIIVIPSYRESEYIEKTLISLDRQINFELSKVLVIVVVNNSVSDLTETLEDNTETINLIKRFSSKFRLEHIDASTVGYSISNNFAGVGYARKIGMDFGLKYSKENTIIHCLDADTVVSSYYLSKIVNSYQHNNIKALIVDFEHQADSNEYINKNIKYYEVFLKKTAKKIDQAGSPYGYVSLGPTITCLAKTYVRIGGMVTKKATEDFYFLQKIRKFTEIYFLNDKLVFPSSRVSDRVYLGTGFRMNESIDNIDSIRKLYYSNNSFDILKKTIPAILSMHNKSLRVLKKKLFSIDEFLERFFFKEGLFNIWIKINNESKTKDQFELQFHKWFDNLKTLKLLKFYSQNG